MFHYLRSSIIFSTCFLAAITLAHADDGSNNSNTPNVKEMQQSIKALEERQNDIVEELSSEKGDVRAFLNDSLSLGGFFDSAVVSGLWGPNTPTQLSTSSHSLAINLAANVNDAFRFNSQLLFVANYPLQNPNNNPGAPSVGFSSTRQFGNFVFTPSLPQAFMEYSTSSAFSVQAGRGYVPFGIAFAQRDLVLFRRRGGPQMLTANTTNDVEIVSPIWSGVHLAGSFRLGENNWGYDVYSLTPNSNPKTLGAGARSWLQIAPPIKFGVSAQTAKRGGYTYEALGGDISLKVDRLGMDAEYVINLSQNQGGNTKSCYLEPYYTFFSEKLLFYVAIDFIDSPLGQLDGTTNIPDPYQKWEFGGGLNWLPYHETRFRFGLLWNDYTTLANTPTVANRDYFALDVSAGVEF